jgi:hydroxymethylpyrimidine kinase/phosphomethylpyrimidine kinase
VTAVDRPAALTIAGSDSGGGAGIQADLRTFTALGCFGTSVVTCATAQNLSAVTRVAALPAEDVRAQMDAVIGGFPVRSVKTGMLFSREIVEAVAAAASAPGFPPLVVDPVMVATSGARLLSADAVEAYRGLVARALVVTPNLDEAAVLLGRPVARAEEMPDAARELSRRLGCSVLLKGGHLTGPPVDVLWHAGAAHGWTGERVEGVNSHGSGCVLSAAVAAWLARGVGLLEACEKAREYLAAAFRSPTRLAGGTLVLGVP